MNSKDQARLARRSYYSRRTQVILVIALLICLLMSIDFNSPLFFVGILGFVTIAALTIRGRMWNRIHVLRSVDQQTDQVIIEDALRNAMPRQPAQPTVEERLTALDGMAASGRISPDEYNTARARILGSM